MLSKNKIKFIQSLESKKNRQEAGLFIAEGEKLVNELLESPFEIIYLAATSEWFKKNSSQNFKKIKETDTIPLEDLKKISFQKSPQEVLCLAKLPQYKLNTNSLKNKLTLMLDTIQDPGNLGTILRIADWFGIEQVICSKETADAYNPKVVQSTMGAICRVKIFYTDLEKLIPEIKLLKIPILGTTLNGDNIYNSELPDEGIIVLGNESKGIQPSWIPLLDQQLFIPYFPLNEQRSESLNVAVAAAIVCSEFRRRMH